MTHYEELYIDPDILVVSKSHSVCVIPDRYKAEKVVLHHLLQEKYGKLYVVHRLDKGTGGVMVFARNKESHRNLSIQFENNKVTKKYLAIINGNVYPQTLMLPIGASNHGRYKINFKSGKKSVTSFTIVDNNEKYSLLEATLYTGRTHQIRVHLKALKTPLYQDFLYGNQIDDKRLSLFAYKLYFNHPRHNAIMFFQSKLSDFFEDLLQKLELSAKSVYQRQ